MTTQAVNLPRRLQELWDGIEENRRTTLEMAGRLTEGEWAVREAGEWSVAEIVEHLVIAEVGTSKVIRKVLKERAGTLPPYPEDDGPLAVRPPRIPPGGASKAPEAALPRGGLGKEALLAMAAEARARTRESLEMMAGADPRAAEFPHPLFGSLNLYEWACFILREHERLHHAQIGAILRMLGKSAP